MGQLTLSETRLPLFILFSGFEFCFFIFAFKRW
ncbi:hypothetical protein MPF_1429 [Methanohalophilus portucalensis FDF-1]|uniref:Uncharacterized protein n=1 Tax=Methanohalophilus portucalensis FDF-1 TaxID=523843 RepID=A0A1L9C311_9EURY|nr:hypothetical protein MPF_1429 [Methanohalophilus portucalensis FDF-1]